MLHCYIFRSEYTVTSIIIASIHFRWLNVWNGYCVGPGRTASTFVAIAVWCAIDLTRSCYGYSMQYDPVCNFSSCAILLSEYTATLTIKSYIDRRWLNVWNGCRVGPGRTARTLVAVAVWCASGLTRSCYECSIQYGAVCNFSSCAIWLCECTAMLITGLASIFFGWMYKTGTMLVLWRTVRTFVAISRRAIGLTRSYYSFWIYTVWGTDHM